MSWVLRFYCCVFSKVRIRSKCVNCWAQVVWRLSLYYLCIRRWAYLFYSNDNYVTWPTQISWKRKQQKYTSVLVTVVMVVVLFWLVLFWALDERRYRDGTLDGERAVDARAAAAVRLTYSLLGNMGEHISVERIWRILKPNKTDRKCVSLIFYLKKFSFIAICSFWWYVSVTG